MMQAFGPLVQQAQGLSDAMVAHLDVPELDGTIGIRVPLPGHEKAVTLTVNNVSIRAEGYRLIAQTANGDYVDLDPGPSLTFQGTIPELEGATVVGSRLPTGVVASIIMEDGKRFWVQPVSDSIPGMDAGLHVIYRGEDVICPEGACGTTALHQVGDMQQEGEGGVAGSCSGGVCLTQVACDADFEFYGLCGSTTQGTQNRIESILNVVNHQYVRELNIAHTITTVLIRTAEPDPYSSTNPNTLLDQFRAQWNSNHSGLTRDVAHLFTGKNLDGSVIGIAFIGVICSSLTTGSGYGLSQSFFSATFACQTDLTAHEIGHNWNAAHCTCGTTTMNPSITCTNTFIGTGSSSVSQIDAHRDSRTCLSNGGIRPANDVCTTATVLLSGGTYAGSNVNATTTGGTDLCTGASGSWGGGERDVWWKFTAHISGTWSVATCGSNFDTVLSIYTGCPGGLNNDVACNDDATGGSCSGTLQSFIQFSATAGQVYYIRVAGYGTATGTISLQLTPPLAFLNTCTLSQTVTSGQVIFGSLFNAGTEGTSSCGSTAGNRARWFNFTAPCNGTLTLSTCGTHDDAGLDTGMDTVLSVHSACPGSAVNQLACNDDGAGDPCGTLDNGIIRDSHLTLAMTAGQNVRIRLSHFSSVIADGRFEFRVGYTSVASPPLINTIADQSHSPCTSSFTGPTPTVLTPSCMTGITWSLQLGPGGMTINSATGVVTWPSPSQGAYLVRVRATNAQGFDEDEFVVNVAALPPVLVNILNATRACGSPPYVGPTPQFTNPGCMNNSATYALITGPAGMTINTSTGVVTWPNPVAGVHNINIRVTTIAGTDDEPWTLSVTNRSPNLDGAGTVGPADLGILLGSWGPGSPPADLNCDGTVGAGDLAILLGAWGTSGFAPLMAPPDGIGRPDGFGDLVGNFGGNGGLGDGAEGDAANPAQPVDVQPLATGGVLKLAGGWSPNANDRLMIQISGIEPVTGHDLLVVEGRALLNGRLLIDLGDHYTPQIGDEITFLAAGELAGQFQEVLTPAMPADRCMDLMYGQQMVTARVLPCDPAHGAIIQPAPGVRVPGAGLSADLTMDRIIDVHDLSLLLDRWGTADPLADLSGNGVVDGADVQLLLEQWNSR